MKPPDVFMKNPTASQVPFRIVVDAVKIEENPESFPDAFCDARNGDYIEVCSLIGAREKRVSLMLAAKRADAEHAAVISLLGDAAFMREVASRLNRAADALDRGEETVRCSLSTFGGPDDLPGAPTVQ